MQRDRCDRVGERLRDPVQPRDQQHRNGDKPEREHPPQLDRAEAERERRETAAGETHAPIAGRRERRQAIAAIAGGIADGALA